MPLLEKVELSRVGAEESDSLNLIKQNSRLWSSPTESFYGCIIWGTPFAHRFVWYRLEVSYKQSKLFNLFKLFFKNTKINKSLIFVRV